ncbi:MAG: tRNA nucleotidyltransferase/poly(A) polymerase [Solidesulfovibrio magneticus str. Maddingley MBC34]|uniref:tRNA nucleotidyltransferase/poly(A) polymerase n=1 Tax=Solidesulfovibrio magneticus str. Maddingley MBC34 TaxID=1206767 RepID=K6H836_9BACT|nr:MAG: tRNA nucleotidyltransferase/poly(A) polymerase [Solidesulfovibrio magneticus str. Maddingley MBC34]
MAQPFKDATAICKTIMRNGYDAYVINAVLQEKALDKAAPELDVATDAPLAEIQKLFPQSEAYTGDGAFARLQSGDTLLYLYPADTADASHPEESVARLTSRLIARLTAKGLLPPHQASPYVPHQVEDHDGFADLSSGEVRLNGIPDEAIRQNYLRAVRALRFSANYNIPVETNTLMAILRASRRIMDYVSVKDIMDEWRKVEAENMADFVERLYDTMILHWFLPEVATLARIKITSDDGVEYTLFEQTLAVMRHYPEELPYDWYGTLACLFHDVGKLHTAQYAGGDLHFYQHHQVGAKVTRKILSRLGFPPDETDLVCNLVRGHMHFHFMLTDRGIRRFRALDQYPRLIEMARADIKSVGGTYKEFNHNMKMLERTETPEEMLEPLLNGAQIMQLLSLKPGPAVGLIRDALLKAQISGDVASREDAERFVRAYWDKQGLH